MKRDDALSAGRFSRRYGPLAVAAGVLTLLLAACIPIPIPHTVVEHGTIRGRVVDDDTDLPLSGVRVHVGNVDGEPDATTDPDGYFSIAERENWRLFCVVPLLPIRPDRRAHIDIIHPGRVPAWEGNRVYRALQLGVRSIRPTRIVGDRGQQNRGMEDDVGTVRLKSYEPVPH